MSCAPANASSPPSLSIKTLKTVHAFERPPSYPASLLRADDGSFYGTASSGRFGLIFKVAANGTFSVLHDFSIEGVGGPTALTLGRDGNLYGIVSSSGAIFKCTLSGAVTILYTLGLPVNPVGLLHGSDGNLYGTTRYGGNARKGSFFRLTPEGEFTTIHSFTAAGSSSHPNEIIEGSPGIFYGTVLGSAPLIFRVTSSGTFNVLHDFSGTNEGFPRHLLQASDGNLYGSYTKFYNATNLLFRLTPDGAFNTVCDFGPIPINALIQGDDANLYCSTGGYYSPSAVSRVSPEGEVIPLHHFLNQNHDSRGALNETPGALVFAPDGTLFGVTLYGSTGSLGTVFHLEAPDRLKTLVRFGIMGAGYSPNQALVQASDGSFYGATTLGGAGGYGTLYHLDPSGDLVTLHEFAGDAGAYPFIVVLAADGRLYGGSIGLDRKGTVFRVETNGEFRILHEFTDGEDGSYPKALVVASDGNVYGVASPKAAGRYGSFFRISPEGTFSVVRAFDQPDEVTFPVGLVEARDGKLYGASAGGYGAIFQISPQGVTTKLHSFPGNGGAQPSNLIAGIDGNLYGTTPGFRFVSHGNWAIISPGTVFQCTPAGEFKDLHSFSGPDGIYYPTALVQSTGGDLYGLAGGLIYRLALTGEFNPLHPTGEFDGVGGGIPPYPEVNLHCLIQGADNKIYGTLRYLGGSGGGAVFEVVFGQPGAVNLSTRMHIGTDDNVSIGGFIVTGNEAKKVMVRAIGPSLGGQSISGRLEDPTLKLHDGSGSVIAKNDNWRETQTGDHLAGDQSGEIKASGIAPTDDRESAIIATLQPGNYTAVVSGNQNATGIGLVEIYDLALETNAQLANISTRGFVNVGDNVMIGGFIVDGSVFTRADIVVRAIGPSLSQTGIPNLLQDPSLLIYDRNGNQYGANDNWKEGQQAEVVSSGLTPMDDRESAIYLSLPAGNYTAVVRGQSDTTGVALVETYNLQ